MTESEKAAKYMVLYNNITSKLSTIDKRNIRSLTHINNSTPTTLNYWQTKYNGARQYIEHKSNGYDYKTIQTLINL